jgi:hypothetical protein
MRARAKSAGGVGWGWGGEETRARQRKEGARSAICHFFFLPAHDPPPPPQKKKKKLPPSPTNPNRQAHRHQSGLVRAAGRPRRAPWARCRQRRRQHGGGFRVLGFRVLSELHPPPPRSAAGAAAAAPPPRRLLPPALSPAPDDNDEADGNGGDDDTMTRTASISLSPDADRGGGGGWRRTAGFKVCVAAGNDLERLEDMAATLVLTRAHRRDFGARVVRADGVVGEHLEVAASPAIARCMAKVGRMLRVGISCPNPECTVLRRAAKREVAFVSLSLEAPCPKEKKKPIIYRAPSKEITIYLLFPKTRAPLRREAQRRFLLRTQALPVP